jgi:undecaprenyl-diphosphatase
MIGRLFTFTLSTYNRLQELALFLPLLLLSAGIWLFIEIADEVTEGDTEKFDIWVLKALRKPDGSLWGPGYIQEAGRDLTALGGVIVLVLVISAVAGYMHLRKKYHAMWLTLGASLSGIVFAGLLKYFFSRERPDIVEHGSIVHTSSFPSGHSLLSAVVYLTLALLLARTGTSWRLRYFPLLVAVVITFLVGVSRIYLGVHYPTDVMAGWTAGGCWALACWTVAKFLQQRGKVEQPDDDGQPGGFPVAPADRT